jgi:CubicO group peptidase (beta-lactamase class C family)
VTKAMTAMLVARLADAGHIGWDTTLAEVFDGVDPGWDGVTVHMLLVHQSGATGSLATTNGPLWEALFDAAGDDVELTRASFAAELLSAPPENTPGETEYSNAGVTLVGAMLEAELGQSWESLLAEWVLDPLDMGGCGFGPPQGDGPIDQPWGHATGSDGLPDPMDPTDVYSDNPPALGPAGTVHCPMVEWGRFGSAHLTAASGDTSFVSAEALTILHTASDDGYVPGMLVDSNQPWANGPALVMNGSNTLWYATIWVAPGIDRAFVTATNYASTGAMGAINDAALHAITEGI